jgi:hypothetical protein
MGIQVIFEYLTEQFLGTSGRWSIVVSEVEMAYSIEECVYQHVSGGSIVVDAEVMP